MSGLIAADSRNAGIVKAYSMFQQLQLPKRLFETVAAYALRYARNKSPGKRLFEEMAFYLPVIAVEAVSLRCTKHGVEVYLAQSTPNDAPFPEWRCPGAVLKPGEGIGQVMRRLATEKLGNPISFFTYVDEFFHQREQSWFLTKIYLVTVDNGPEGGVWWPVDELPQNIAWHDANNVIPQAAQFYLDLVSGNREQETRS